MFFFLAVCCRDMFYHKQGLTLREYQTRVIADGKVARRSGLAYYEYETSEQGDK